MSASPWLDTIAAIATPVGEGAISLIRLSGKEAVGMAAKVFRSRISVSEMVPRQQYFGGIYDQGTKVDDVLLTVFRAPASYTGEDVVEITGHGGILVTRQILELLLSAGARHAAAGEFTQRAFENGKMDLTQAEAVMDLITAQSGLALRAAHEQLAGQLSRRIVSLEDRVLEVLAHTEAYIDFPDQDIDPETGESLRARMDAIAQELDALLATADRGKVVREGVRSVIYGAPNVGKSSLLNLLLGYDRAIVSATPGTTRDSIQETISLRGLPLRLVDTAGIRQAEDAVEQAGIARTQQEIERADLVLEVYDSSREKPEGAPANSRALLILNKADLDEHPSWSGTDAVRLSCLSGIGTDALEQAIERRVLQGGAAQADWSVAINTRHQAHLQQARRDLEAARSALDSDLSPEFVAEELRAVLSDLGDIVGRKGTEDLLGKIFSTFCIGK